MRLAGLEGLYQEEAAMRMNVSRATFGRVINEAHQKVADTIIYGKVLTIVSRSVGRADMKVCFAVEKNDGINSAVYGHFGSAPLFIVVDTNQKVATPVINKDVGHAHGACNPLRSIGGQPVDAVVVGGIGAERL